MNFTGIEQQHRSGSEQMVPSPAIGLHRATVNNTDRRDTMEMFRELIFLVRPLKQFNALKTRMPPDPGLIPISQRSVAVVALNLRIEGLQKLRRTMAGGKMIVILGLANHA